MAEGMAKIAAIMEQAEQDRQALAQKFQAECARLSTKAHADSQHLLAELTARLDDREQNRETGQKELDEEKEAFFKMQSDIQTKFASTLNGGGNNGNENGNEHANGNDNDNEKENENVNENSSKGKGEAKETLPLPRMNVVDLNVGGHKFQTSLQTLRNVPNSALANLFSGRFAFDKDKEGNYFIDRDGTHFRHILNYLRDLKLNSALDAKESQDLLAEAIFYQIEGLVELLKPKGESENESHGIYRFEVSEPVRKALGLNKCTFTETRKNYEFQKMFQCRDCPPVGSRQEPCLVCTICAETCHKGHELGTALYGISYCDCGRGKGTKTPCKAL